MSDSAYEVLEDIACALLLVALVTLCAAVYR